MSNNSSLFQVHIEFFNGDLGARDSMHLATVATSAEAEQVATAIRRDVSRGIVPHWIPQSDCQDDEIIILVTELAPKPLDQALVWWDSLTTTR